MQESQLINGQLLVYLQSALTSGMRRVSHIYEVIKAEGGLPHSESQELKMYVINK